MIGAPGATSRSILGTLLSLAGAGGLAALLFMGLKSTWGEPLSYDAFSASVFFFVVLLGASAGIFHASLDREEAWTGLGTSHLPAILWALAGAAAGYPLGILAALWIQKLGFLAFLPILAARLGLFGLIATDLVLLFRLR